MKITLVLLNSVITGIWSLHCGADDSGLAWITLSSPFLDRQREYNYRIAENFRGRKLLQIWRI